MSTVSVESVSSETAAYGGLIDALGGIGAAVLAIIGLTGFDPAGMAGIATIVLGGAFLVQAGSILTEYTQLASRAATLGGSAEVAGGDGLAAMFLVGAAGIVLGVLALLGIASAALTAVAVIAYGSALVLSSGSVRQLYRMRGQAMLVSRSGPELIAGQMASGSAGVQLLSGLAAVVLGILAVAGHAAGLLTLAALLVLGVTVLMSGSALGSVVLSFVRQQSDGQRRSVV